ncbi:uncharacterized protein [Triticum aestivum]|uniref:uncharacterized protein n=1 Tax=Triticum aestivum TaxID=4565 RepID=UPI001D01A7AE|nr:uncharacterized protein LOC123139193 [Triticum aestivum]
MAPVSRAWRPVQWTGGHFAGCCRHWHSTATATSKVWRPGDARVRERGSGSCCFIPRATSEGGGVPAMACTHRGGRADPEGRHHLEVTSSVRTSLSREHAATLAANPCSTDRLIH